MARVRWGSWEAEDRDLDGIQGDRACERPELAVPRAGKRWEEEKQEEEEAA